MNVAGCNNLISHSDTPQNYAASPQTSYTQSDNNKTPISEDNYSLPSAIDNYDEWKKAMYYVSDNLIEEATFIIFDYSDEKYPLSSLMLSDASIRSSGSILNGVATITYKLDYKDNFKLIRASEDSSLISKLSQENLNTFMAAKYIADSVTNYNMTDYEKEKAIHDYFVLNYRYGCDTGENSEAYTIKGLFENKCGYCEAYAYAYKIVADMAGLDCRIAKGTLNGTPHAWNIVKIGGEYYHLDVTGDDPVPDVEGRIIYNYFNLTDSEIARTHVYQKELSENISCTGTHYNYYRYNNLIVDSMDELENYINRKIDAGENTIEFYTNGFVINSAQDIKYMFNKPIISHYEISGNFGSQSAYTLHLTRR